MIKRKRANRAAALLLALWLVFGFLAVPVALAAEEPAPTTAVEPDLTEPAPDASPTPTESSPDPAPSPEAALPVFATAETAVALYDAPPPLSESIPVIAGAITTPIVLIDGGGTQTGYTTLAAAMTAIGAATPGGDYTLVFVQDYAMNTSGADMNAITNNSGNAASLTVTSTYQDSGGTETTSKVTASNDYNCDWNFQSAATLVHHFNYNSPRCSRILACGHNLTLGTGITTAGTNIQLYVGSTGSTTSSSGSLTVQSGTYNYALAGGYKSGTYTGSSSVTVQGTAKVGSVYAGGVASPQASNSKVSIEVGSSEPGFVCPAVRLYGMNSSAGSVPSGLTEDGTLDFTLVNVTRAGVNMTLNSNVARTTLRTKGTTTINGTITADNLVVEDGTLSSNNTVTLTDGFTVGAGATYNCSGANPATAANLTLQTGATLNQSASLTLTGNVTLGENATYTGAAASTLNTADIALGQNATMVTAGPVAATGSLTLGEGAAYRRSGTGKGGHTVAGNLNVTGPNAKIQIFKSADDSGAPGVADYLTIGGSYTGTDILGLALCDADGAAMPPRHGDTLLDFTEKANAPASRNTLLAPPAGYSALAIDGKIVVTDQPYAYPSYYRPTATAHLYQYEEVQGSTGNNRTVYRIYKQEGGVWKVYPADEHGTPTAPALSEADQVAEHPQPNTTAPVTDYNACFGTMLRLDRIGSYRMAVAAATNYESHHDDADYNTASGAGTRPLNIANLPAGITAKNSSRATLVRSSATSNISEAYLVMTTALHNNNPVPVSLADAQALLNTPMRLVAENGDAISSNGYLPAGELVNVADGATSQKESDKPTLLYHGYKHNETQTLGEAMTITDVTDFVKTHGYGNYYGVDIPAYNTDPDAAIGWRLIVIEEDREIQKVRKVGIQMGPISNGSRDVGIPTNVLLSLDGFTTPDQPPAGEIFSGQLLMIGSDNLSKSNAEKGSNLHNSFSPNPEGTEGGAIPATYIPIGSNDPNTIGVDRPVDNNTAPTIDYWSQGLMDHNGVRLGTYQTDQALKDAALVDPIRANGAMGLDLSLLDVTNEKNEHWYEDGPLGGGHNLYLVPQSKSVGLRSVKDGTGIGYIDVLGLSTEIAIPEFTTDIVHADQIAEDTEGVDVVAGHTVVVKMKAHNVTPLGDHVLGTFNTKAVVTVDPLLYDLRPYEGTGGENDIVATFHDYKPKTGTYVETPVTGHYDALTHTITFDFGSEGYDYDDKFETNNSADIPASELKYFNSCNDWIELKFLATTAKDPTIDKVEEDYENTIGIFGKILYQYGRFDKTPETRYAYDDDIFNTFLPDVTFTKQVKGDLGDTDNVFTFTATIYDGKGEAKTPLAAGTEVTYTYGKLAGVPTAPVPATATGQLTVATGGKVSFTLQHGQTITLKDLPPGCITVQESDADDCVLSWQDRAVGTVTTVPAEDNYTITELNTSNESYVDHYTFDLYNTKESSVPTGVRSKLLPFVLLALALLAGLSFTTVQVITDPVRHKRE